MNYFRGNLKSAAIFTFFLTVVTIVCVFLGCKQSPQTIAYKTLASVGQGVDAAEKAYLDGVIKGVISANSLPTIEKDYNTFQRDYGAALAVAEGSTNAFASAAILAESASFISETSTAK